MTMFVEMYHPMLDNLIVDVPAQAVDDYAARGWLLVDPDAMPVVVHPYLTQAAGDSRYVRDTELDAQAAALVADTASALSVAQRAAFGSRWKASTAYAQDDVVINPSGQLVKAKAAFTSGGSYSATNWTVIDDLAYARAETPLSLPAGTLLAHRYDPQRQAYNCTPDTLRLWNAALARIKTSGGAAARVTVVGHSYVVGTSTSPRHTGSFATKLRDLFNARYGSAGTGIVYMVTTALTDESRIVVNGTWSQALGTRGAFNAGAYNATGTGNTIVFTPDIPVDSFNVYYVRNTVGGVFSASVDGGTAVTADSVKSGAEALGVLNVPAGSLGMHKLTITAPSSGQVYIVGVEGIVGSSGVRVSRVGRSGATLSTVITAGSGTEVDSLGTIFNSAPDLTVVMCEVNDYLNAVSIATFKANLTTLVNKAKLSGDVLVCVDPNVMTQPNATSGLYQSAYHAAIYELADSLNFGVLDIAARWKDYTTAVAVPPGLMASAGVDATGVHPYYAGHQDIAQAIMAVVGGSTPQPVAPARTKVAAELHGFVAASYDPFIANTPTTTGGGTHLLLVRCVAQVDATITNIYVGIGTAGSGATATAGQTPQAAIYSATGQQLGVTGDIGALLTGTTGMKALPLLAGVPVTQGQEIYLALFWSGTTSPLITRASSQTFMFAAGVGSVPANQRFADNQGLTSLPASINPASLSAAGVPWWLGAA